MCSRLLHRIGVDADQAEHARGGGADAVAQALRRRRSTLRGGAANELRIDSGSAGRAAGRVDGEVGGVAQARDARAVLAPSARPFFHSLGLLRRECVGRRPARARLVLVDPRAEVCRAAGCGNVSSRLPRSPLGSMAIAGMPSMAASSSSARHSPVLPLPVMPTQTACVTRSLRVVEQQVVGGLARREVVLAAEVEDAELFEVLHAPLPAQPALQDKLATAKKVRFPRRGATGPRGGRMTIRATPQAAPCGALIEGVDLRGPLAAQQVAAIRALWLQHQVLVFPDQQLDFDQLERSPRRSGRSARIPTSARSPASRTSWR